MRIVLFFILLSSFALSQPQGINQIKKVEGVFIGRSEGGYSFCSKTALGIEEILVFDEVLSVILETYPVHDDKHIGENFIISFIENNRVWEDSSKKTSTVIRLQKLMPGQHLQE